VKPNASNRRLNSVALAFLAEDIGSPPDILRAAWYAFDSRIRSRRRSPSPSTPLPMLRAASSLIAHTLSSAGEVRNGSSRMKEGVRLGGIGQEIRVASTRFKPQCGKRRRRLRSDPPPQTTGHVALFGRRRNTIAITGEVDDSEIDTEHILDADFFWVWYVTDNGEIPLTTHEHQIDFALAKCEQSALAFAADERNLHPADERPDAHHVIGDEAEYAIVVGLGGMLAESDNSLSSGGFLRRVGVGHLGDAAHRGLGCQFEGLAGADIEHLVQIVLSGNASIKATLRNRVTGSIAALKRVAKRLRLLCCRVSAGCSQSISRNPQYSGSRYVPISNSSPHRE
jgi:hypothetical protein